MTKKLILLIVVVPMLGIGACFAFAALRAAKGIENAQAFLEHQLWPQARKELRRYLWLRPGDDQAKLLMAEALVKDDTLPPQQAASRALWWLAKIPDASPLGSRARLQQGRVAFLILHRPGQAESFLRRAAKLDSDNLEAYLLLWKVMEMTGRWEMTEPVFWQVYRLTPQNERPLRLREWYMSQFSPVSANESLDRLLGILGPEESPTHESEARRYLHFRQREPQAPVNHAAVAHWCQQEGDPKFALQILETARKELDDAAKDPFFLSVLVATLLDLGEFDRAQAWMQQWPATARTHLYWKWQAIILDEVCQDGDAALSAYDRALEKWPGPMQLRLLNRKASCLARRGYKDRAQKERVRAAALEELLSLETHERLRHLLGFLQDPDKLTEVAEFYQQLGRPQEAKCWIEHIRRLRGDAKSTFPNTGATSTDASRYSNGSFQERQI